MKHLIVDEGNTRIKTVIFKKNIILSAYTCKGKNFSKIIDEIFSKNKISKVILSSVGNFTNKTHELLKNKQEVLTLSNKTNVPFVNLYKSPNTLGVDRIALVSAASVKYPNDNVLIIDAGTCVTFDFKNSKNEYLGGGISPGLKMRYKSLAKFTKNLPKLKFPFENFDKNLIGSDTESGIHSGVINGLLCEIEGIIKNYNDKFKNLTVVLTGGDCYYLSKNLKNGIFANPNFLLEGLNAILIHNTK